MKSHLVPLALTLLGTVIASPGAYADPPLTTLRGHVAWQGAVPADLQGVSVTAACGAATRVANVAADGSFEVRDVPAGRCVLRVEPAFCYHTGNVVERVVAAPASGIVVV